MGLTEDQAKKVMDSLDWDFVTKMRFNEELKTAKKSVSDRDKQLEDLKKSAGDNIALAQQIAYLQKANADQQKTHEQEIAALKFNNAVELALTRAKAKKTGRRCRIYGYVYEGDNLLDDFICPICKHGASDFERI